LEGLRLNAHQNNLPIYFTDVRPGFIDTAMAKGEGLFWVAPVQKASLQILDAIKQRKKVVYITKRWSLIALVLRIIPYSILKRI
jgi:short-subunit dehydrogenase